MYVYISTAIHFSVFIDTPTVLVTPLTSTIETAFSLVSA